MEKDLESGEGDNSNTSWFGLFKQEEKREPPPRVENVGLLRSISNKITGATTSVRSSVTNAYHANYQYFAICFVTGMALIILSFFFLPIIIIAPQKFALLFSLGSVCVLASFAFLKPPREYLGSLFMEGRAIFTLAYLCSLLLNIWASLIHKSYFLVIICSSIEGIAMLWFVCSFFPGGKTGMMTLSKLVFQGCASCFAKLFRS